MWQMISRRVVARTPLCPDINCPFQPGPIAYGSTNSPLSPTLISNFSPSTTTHLPHTHHYPANMPDIPSSTSYRNPRVEDDDEDDLDDLDDVLASFNAPPKPTAGKRSYPHESPKAGPPALSRPPASDPSPAPAQGADDDDDFEASLVEGMESLLRQLAGDHPPGPMPGETSTKPAAKPFNGEKDDGKSAGQSGELSAEEEEAAWQRAVEMMLSGEGLAALGLDSDGKSQQTTPPPPRPSQGPSSAGATGGGEAKPDFEETIRRTMEQLKQPKATAGGAGGGDNADLAALLAQLGTDPSALDGLGEGDDELGGLLDGMMAQLMTKEVLEEPMSELASKYPGYLANPPAGTSPADLEKYKQQHVLVSAIVETFRKPGYTDDKDGKEVARLVGEMQDLGGPPSEIMGDLPEGFDLGALGGNEDGCTIM
ncbi:putative peroxisome biogenesis protein peroxin 19 [Papiliotrema laurentii]|uniref:Peroxisome biogenesis protein peroxin 19 n=1 Tax=Papiliotrema laurentii TaxID=5418 RepID=A0AAD9FT14_PAPLA|nr:putative peroxisome biogenesis protein peroxin 19 [Papiliotrema laurentii]